MPELCTFDYAIIRVVPWVEREEFLNAGVLLFCSTQAFLDARIDLDHQRLTAFAPALHPQMLQEYLNTMRLVCTGGTIPLACRPPQHDHPNLTGALRPLPEPRSGPRTTARRNGSPTHCGTGRSCTPKAF
jgi:hypothetical protein